MGSLWSFPRAGQFIFLLWRCSSPGLSVAAAAAAATTDATHNLPLRAFHGEWQMIGAPRYDSDRTPLDATVRTLALDSAGESPLQAAVSLNLLIATAGCWKPEQPLKATLLNKVCASIRMSSQSPCVCAPQVYSEYTSRSVYTFIAFDDENPFISEVQLLHQCCRLLTVIRSSTWVW